MKRTIFGLLAFFLLVPLAHAGGGPAQLNLYDTPAEARWAPFFDDMPACDDAGVLSTISGRFGQTQREFWDPQSRDPGLRSRTRNRLPLQRPVLHSAPLLRRPRRDDAIRKTRTVAYAVGTQLGIIGVTWGVEWCVVGIDPTLAYAPDCEVIRPILEREIGKAKWLAEYGLKAGN